MTGRCVARADGVIPAPRCILERGHGLREGGGRAIHSDDDGCVWVGPGDPCPCGHEEDADCECGVSRLAFAQRNQREDESS